MRKSLLLIAVLLISLIAIPSAYADNPEEMTPGLFGTSVLEGWSKSVGVSVSGSDGNTSETKFIADAKGDYENDQHRMSFKSQFYLSKPDSPDDAEPKPRTDRKAFAEFEENWKPFDNDFYFIGTIRYDYDRFLLSKHRISPSAGVGTTVINTEDLKVRGSVGAGLSHTWDTMGDTIPEGMVRVGGDYNVTKGITFTTTHTYYPNFDETEELRIISDAELKADIGEEGGLTASVGLNNEYDTTADDINKDIERNDLTYFLRLGYDF